MLYAFALCALLGTEGDYVIGESFKDFGVACDKLRATQTTLNGHAIDKPTAFAAVGSPQLPDEAGRKWLVVIGSEAYRKRIVDSIPVSARAKLLVQEYAADSPLLPALGYRAGAATTVYVVEPNGKVVFRQEGDNLDALLALLLKALGVDGGNASPDASPLDFDWGKIPAPVYLILGIVIFLLGRGTKK